MTEITARLSAALGDRYQIERHLGEGGMASVYLAEDLKHKRKVALKVLKPDLAAVLGAERFVQEITTTASLQHPNILPLFDSGEADAFLYYVMPYIEGETLRDKLNRETQLGIEEAVQITTDVAEALQAAHEEGVIHRDVKPENILLHKGRAIVADFGIALAVSAAAGGRMTETGLSLGTPHYMSPEQATAEKDVTARSDIYSLGSVLYEMLTGEPPHTGASAQQIIMKIVTEEAQPVTALRKSVPPHVAAATARSLEKLPADRFETAKAFARALTDSGFTHVTTRAGAPPAVSRASRWNSLTIGLASALVVTTGVALWQIFEPSPPALVARYSVRLPVGHFMFGGYSRLALSPDGTRLVYVASQADGSSWQLWQRRLDQLDATPIPGTWAANGGHAFSPDGQSVAFVGRGALQVVSLDGGPPVQITDSIVGGAGTTWAPDGFIYAHAAGPTALVRVRETGGAPEWFTTLDSARGEIDHTFPEALPNGRGILFVVSYASGAESRNIAVADVETGAHTLLFRGVFVRYAPSGHLLYTTNEGTLLAVRFDQDALNVTGDPVTLVDRVRTGFLNVPDLTVSATGTMMYSTGADRNVGGGEPVWVDREGQVEPVAAGWRDDVTAVALSPDGSRLAVTIGEAFSHGQIWVRHLTRGTVSRLTFEGERNDRPVWTPDGRSIAFMTDRMGSLQLFQRRVDGTGEAERLLYSPNGLQEVRYTSDGEWLIYRTLGGPASDLYARRVAGDTTRVLLAGSEFQETAPVASPDGRWLAFVSNETGGSEVYVHPFPNVSDGRWLVSIDGGSEPIWSQSGDELFYRNGDKELMAVEVLASDGRDFVTGEQRTLFSTRPFREDVFHQVYDVTPDGQRFVMIQTKTDQADTFELIVVENFFEELKAKVGN